MDLRKKILKIFEMGRASSGWKRSSGWKQGCSVAFLLSSIPRQGRAVEFWCVVWGFRLCGTRVLAGVGAPWGVTQMLCVCGAFDLREAVRLHSLFHLTCACPAQTLLASCPLPALFPVLTWNSLAVYIDLSSL